MLLLSVPLGVGTAVASNQVLTDAGWSWGWTGVAVAVAAAGALVAFWLTRPSGTEPDPSAGLPDDGGAQAGQSGASATGERSVVVSGDNSGIISTGGGSTNIQMNARVSGQGRAYQAGRDQTINE
ncbi:hypothetical protein [Nonomuraea endophytica]|uniref:Uncharacterized protein n=1 Tax=Nonomuraea endophytica TaxID=714136 RepID=A0A7W8EHQ0_9ACTN|nr:hypothetical protein [Nonomuraea endophytica]MBB5079763.1 hypothetical protein [Nonomuraea endophytica]